MSKKQKQQQPHVSQPSEPWLIDLLGELEKYTYSTSIITFISAITTQPLSMDLERTGQRIRYGYAPDHKRLLMRMLQTGGALILRSFLTEIDPASNLPVKELRSWFLLKEGGTVLVNRLDADAMFTASNTDAETGERLPIETSVRYC